MPFGVHTTLLSGKMDGDFLSFRILYQLSAVNSPPPPPPHPLFFRPGFLNSGPKELLVIKIQYIDLVKGRAGLGVNYRVQHIQQLLYSLTLHEIERQTKQ